MTDDLQLRLTTLRRMAVERLETAHETEKIATETRKIHNYDTIAEESGWRFCERCNSYEEYDDDKCKRCSNPLYRYSARGEGNAR